MEPILDAAAPASERSRVKRKPNRGVYDRAAIHRILDEGLVASVGFVMDDQPFVIPMAYVRVGDAICLHGSPASRMLQALATGIPVCITVTLTDGLVLARTAFRHSMNYRSAMIFGTATEITDSIQKYELLRALTEHLVPQRWNDLPEPTANELNSTMVLTVAIEEASAKVRAGGPLDTEESLLAPIWAGVIPLQTRAGTPIPDARLRTGISVPDYVSRYLGATATD